MDDAPDVLDPPEHLWGFGGLHGGLALALLVARMRAEVADVPLRYVTGQFHRPLRSQFAIEQETVRAGASARRSRARAVMHDSIALTAEATFGVGIGDVGISGVGAVAPAFPGDVPQPDDCEPFFVPPELVPFATHTEVRPVGPNRPYGGADEPSLTAWVRLIDDDLPPDVVRLVMLLDAIAPSYTTILRDVLVVPTVELSVRPGSGLDRAWSPWVLLHAQTIAMTDGWIDERVDAWSPDGLHLGGGVQVRLLRT